MKKIFCFLFLCINAAALAQKVPVAQKQKAFFFSANQLGLMEGAKGSAFLMQTVNGINYKGWGAGLGAGIDKYAERSIPVFLQVQRQLPTGKAPLSLYADAGLNIPWKQGNEQDSWGTRENRSGLYFDAGLQYNWRLNGDNGLVFSLGYTEKRNSVEQTAQAFCITLPCAEQKSSWMYTYRRIALKAGWRLR